MSRLTDLLTRLRSENAALAADLDKEIAALSERRSFGLNFERHVPEAVELPGRKIRKGDKVRVLPPRGEVPRKADENLWRVVGIDRTADMASLEALATRTDDSADASQLDTTEVALNDLVVVAEFRDPIYPGLVSTGRVERGGDKPSHVVINSENFHALETLLFTDRGRIDCIYIDPPYNTLDRTWKYNNNYVNSDDLYRHSKWLAFMERRLLIARELLSPSGVLIVTIDENELHRLGLLVNQTFPDYTQQLITIVNNPKGVTQGAMSRVEEYAIFVFAPEAQVSPVSDDLLTHRSPADDPEEVARPRWKGLLRSGDDSARADRPNMFYPVWLDPETRRLDHVGEPLPAGEDPDFDATEGGLVAAWPIRRDGSQGRWGVGAGTLSELIEEGLAACGGFDRNRRTWGVSYLSSQLRDELAAGRLQVLDRDPVTGVADVAYVGDATRRARTVWHRSSHDAGAHGTDLIRNLLGTGRAFPFPKSLYAVEDAVRLAVGRKPEAIVLDYFAGSGTTAHAVMRLNHQDGGRRRSILVTNNEVAPDEQRRLRDEGLRPGDTDWERWGICEYITKPRIKAAATGHTPDGVPISGNYRFIDEFPMANGFDENVEFFTLTYEAPLRVASNREFLKVAPMLWMRAGSRGRRIDDIAEGWDVADTYGVLADLDRTEEFLKAVAAQGDGINTAFVVTDEDRLFESVARELPEHVEPVRLYESYLRNFEIESGRGAL